MRNCEGCNRAFWRRQIGGSGDQRVSSAQPCNCALDIGRPSVVEDDRGPCPHERLGDGEAQAPARPGHQRGLAAIVEADRHHPRYLLTLRASAVEPMLSRMRSVATALIEGSRVVRTIPHTMVGSVLPLPMVKKVITKSSSESARAMRPAPTIVGCTM